MARKKPHKGKADLDLESVANQLRPFLAANPYSNIERTEDENKESHIEVVSPWGDKSLALRLDEKPTELADALNSLVLPERLSAIWHQDKRSLEVVWTAFRLSKDQAEIKGRSFTFKDGRNDHICKFSKSSNRLLTIAKYCRPVTMSETNFRNMPSFISLTKSEKRRESYVGLGEPLSFWISNIDWDQELTIALLSRINFYLRYYDEKSPTILIHAEPSREAEKFAQRTRYVHGAVPGIIVGRSIDPNVLSFWSAASSGNPSMQFILYYRIIEYASNVFLDAKTRGELKRLLARPSILDELDSAIEQIVTTCVPGKMDDIVKFRLVITSCVEPQLLWREIEANATFFKKATRFDGGFIAPQLISSHDTFETFEKGGLDKLANTLRDIRNTLSHGRDVKTATVITPTSRNFDLLRPWVHLIGTAAGEVAIFQNFA